MNKQEKKKPVYPPSGIPSLHDMVIALEVLEAKHPYDSPAIEVVQQAIDLRVEEIYEYSLKKLA